MHDDSNGKDFVNLPLRTKHAAAPRAWKTQWLVSVQVIDTVASERPK